MRRTLASITLATALTACGPSPDDAHHETARPAASHEFDTAIDRGVAYLVGSQNKSGSWGSPASTLIDIYAPVPGSFPAFDVAATSLAVSGLVETGKRAAILVPSTAVEDGGFDKWVYVTGADGRPARRAVGLGQPFDDRIEVTSGLAEGDKVLVTAPKK